MSFRLKTFLGIALIQAVLLTILLFNRTQYLEEVASKQLEERTAGTLALAKAMSQGAILSSDIAGLQGFANVVAATPSVVYVRVLMQNRVVASAGDPENLKRPFSRDIDLRHIDDDVFDRDVSISLYGVEYGRIELGISTSIVRKIISDGVRQGIFLALGSIVLVGLFSFALGIYLTRHLKELKYGAERLSAGQYGHAVPVRGHDDLAEAAMAFNSMSATVARTHNALAESEARFKSVFETAVFGIITINSKGMIQSANPATAKLFGYSVDELIGQNINMLMPDPYHSAHDGYLRNYLETGKAKVIGIGREVPGRRRDGSTFPLELSVSEFRLGNERMFTGMVRDISEQKNAERLKSEFVSTVSHELRTPLTAIRGSLGLVTGCFAESLPEKGREMLTLASNNCERLGLLINDLLDLEKLESGRIELAREPLDLVVLAQEAVQANEGYAQHHDVHLKLNLGVYQAPILGDRLRLMQVFANLISNAVKFSPQGETVEIGVSGTERRLRVTVQDKGPGIPAEFKNRIFSRFAQADSSDSRQKGGTGLGLSITKAIVEQHGGQIAYKSVVGVGTVFYFELPLVAMGVADDVEKHVS